MEEESPGWKTEDVMRIHVFVEGQTEESFVRELLIEYFSSQGVHLNPILVRTSRTGKGGVVSYAKIRRQVERKCLEDSTSCVTTMIDLAKLPTDFPGKDSILDSWGPVQRVEHLEAQWRNDLCHRNFYPNIVLHEFESLLFSDLRHFSAWFCSKEVNRLLLERQPFSSPELVNEGPETTPFKRISRCCPKYQKTLHGPLIALDIGLDAIRRECEHFNSWIEGLVSLGAEGMSHD